MRGGYIGHILAFVIAVRTVICFFVCAGCFARVVCIVFCVCCVCLFVFRTVVYAWRLSWSHLGVCDRCLFRHLLLWLCRLFYLL